MSLPHQKRPPIIVYGRHFDPDSGGGIVLHYLVDRLRALGVEAYLCQPPKHYPFVKWSILRMIKEFNQRRKLRRTGRLRTHAAMNVPVLSVQTRPNTIAIYPETIDGNPAEAKIVVRWLLHKPGYFGGAQPDPTDLVYYYQEAFLEGLEGSKPEGQLRIRWLRDDIYFNSNPGPRTKSCRMVRKGPSQAEVPDFGPADAIILDGKSHEEMAQIFNECDTFYCHDPYTMYCYYAALCGCTPIVVPQKGLSAEEWRAGFELKHGVGYGVAEHDWARRTKDQLLRDMETAKATELEDVKRLVERLAQEAEKLGMGPVRV